MKYICLGYMDEKAWENMSQAERNTFIDSVVEAGRSGLLQT
jgi:hypothetical protein